MQAPTSEVISPSIDAAYIDAPYIKLGQEYVGHADMPDFDFTVKGTDGLLAYL